MFQDFRTCQRGRFTSGFVTQYFNPHIPKPTHGMVNSGNFIPTTSTTTTPKTPQSSTRHIQVKLTQNQVITDKNIHDCFSA